MSNSFAVTAMTDQVYTLQDTVYTESNKIPYAVKSVGQVPSMGMQTPVSLAPRARLQSSSGGYLASESLLLEPASRLYAQHIGNDTDMRLGHFTGAIALMWFTPWDKLKNLICGGSDLASIPLNLSVCFLRYAKYLVNTANIPPHLLSTALLYIFRFRQRSQSPIVGSPTSEARLLATALMTADKYEDDVCYTTATWAKISNISVEDLKKMEIEFLIGLDFRLHVSVEEALIFGNYLQNKLFPLIDRLVYM